MVKIGFTVVCVVAQTVYHAAWLVLTTLHGDFTEASEAQSLDMLDEALEEFFVLEKMPRTGHLEFSGTSEGQFTKRTVGWSADGFNWRADISHGEKVVCIVFMTSETRR